MDRFNDQKWRVGYLLMVGHELGKMFLIMLQCFLWWHTLLGEDGRSFDDVVIYSGNWAAACPRIGFKGQIGISYQPPLSTASEKTTGRRTTCLLRSIIKFEHIYNRAIHPCLMNLAQNNTMLAANSTMFPMRLEIVSIKWVQDPGQLGTTSQLPFLCITWAFYR